MGRSGSSSLLDEAGLSEEREDEDPVEDEGAEDFASDTSVGKAFFKRLTRMA
jgi:hypothetical protein